MNPFRYLPPSVKSWVRRRAGAASLADRLQNLRRAGFRPRRIIDAGAFEGEWSLTASTVFPDAQYLLIEPQPQLADRLNALCREQSRFQFRSALLGRQRGRAAFLLQKSNSRIVTADHQPGESERVVLLPVEPLAAIAAAAGFASPDFVKLDLQGHELEALAGAGEIFGQTEVIQTEVSWLRIGDVPLVAEAIARFEERGYRAYDIFGCNYRPLDGALWQTDMIFVRASSPLLASRVWT